MRVGYDWAWARPDLAAIKHAGGTFVMRYLCYPDSDPQDDRKRLQPGELATLLAAGLDVGLVWEAGALGMKGGGLAGSRHAKVAVGQARSLGFPPGTCIYYAADWNATEADQAAINAYLRAARTVHGSGGYRVGIYGGYFPVMRALDAGVADLAWQTYGWSLGRWDGRAALRQVHNSLLIGGGDVDRDEQHHDDAGLYLAGGGNEMDARQARELENLARMESARAQLQPVMILQNIDDGTDVTYTDQATLLLLAIGERLGLVDTDPATGLHTVRPDVTPLVCGGGGQVDADAVVDEVAKRLES